MVDRRESLPFHGADELETLLASHDYLPNRETSVALYLAFALGKPLFVEGPAGVGKTALAKAIAGVTGRTLLRLQCYEGLDESRALYEWEYGKQMLYAQLLRDHIDAKVGNELDLDSAIERISGEGRAFFDHRFLLARPLLQALQSESPVVLLIDEVDRSDPEFEALLLEVLSDYQVTIPELGTITARSKPLVVLTSNGTRDMTDALRRRCLHLFLDYPEPSRELEIVRAQVPQASERLAKAVVHVANAARALSLEKPPSVAETVEWARAIVLLGSQELDAQVFAETLSVLAKHRNDAAILTAHVDDLLSD